MNENPNVQEFTKNTQALRVVSAICGSVRGNCGGNKDKTISVGLENTPLNKEKPIGRNCRKIHASLVFCQNNTCILNVKQYTNNNMCKTALMR